MSQSIYRLFDNLLPVRSGRRERSTPLGALALALVLPALMLLAACATGYHGLPPGLTIPAAGGLTVTSPPPNPQPGVVGQTYSTQVVFNGGLAPYGCTASGLPPGLTVMASSVPGSPCVISGTPTTIGIYNVTFTVTDSSQPVQSVPDSFTITINSAFGLVNFTPGSGEVGVAYSQTFMAMGGVGALKSCSLAPAVAGLNTSFNATSCTISGTPTATFGPAMVTITTMDTGAPPGTPQSTSTQMANLTIFAHIAVTPFAFPTGEVGSAYNLALATTGGVPPLAGCAFTGAAPAGLAVNAVGTNCVVTGTPTAVFGPAMVTVTATDSALSPPNTPAPVTGSSSASFTVNPMLAVSNFAFTTGEVGSAYNLTINTTNGIPPLTACMFTPALPAGLVVNPVGATCVVSGTPTVAFGPTNLTLTATDSGDAASTPGMNTNSASLTVNAQLSIPAFVLGNGEVGAVYNQAIPTTGGILPLTACTFAPPLPAGLAVNVVGTTCVVSGTPTAAFAPASMKLSATDTGSADSAPFTGMTTSTNMFQVFSALALANTLGNGEVNAAYSSANAGATEPAISGGNTGASSYACAFMGAAPAGLNVAWNGVLGAAAGCTVSGTPTAVFGPATVSIMVTETPAPSASSAAGVVTVVSNSIQIFSILNIAVTLGNGEINAPYSSTNLGATEPAISGGNPAATSYACALTGAPPIGLAAAWNNVTGANAGCTVSGTPTALFGPAPVTVQVTESPAPSTYSAAGTTSGNSNAIQIYSALSLTATLGNGEVTAAYSSTNAGATEPAISGGNPAATTYACTFNGASPAGLTAVWNGSTGAAAGCTVSGTPTAIFGPATTMIKVTDMTPSPYSAAGTFTATSNSIQIFAQVTLATFALGDGETNAGYSHTGIAITNGVAPYNCTLAAASTLAAGLAIGTNAATCTVTGTPTAVFAAPVTIQVMDTAPSAYSAAATNTTTSTGNLNIFAGITFATPFPLGDGVVNSPFNETVPPPFMGGNAAYTCTFVPPAIPAGLTTTWNGNAGSPACNVTGTPTAVFGPGTVTIQVQDTPRSADQTTPSTVVASSQAIFQIFAALTVVNPTSVNDLVNVPYPGITFKATGGFTNGTVVTWTAPGNVSGSGLCTPPLPGLPTGLTLNTSDGAITGTPTATGVYTFVVCVEDNAGSTSTMPIGVNSSPAITIKILGHLAFASGTADSTVQVIDVSSNTFVQSIALPAGAVPAGIALNAEGGFAFVADSFNNTIIPIDTVALTAGVPVPLGTCTSPVDVATTPSQTKPGKARLYVACTSGSFDIVVLDIANPAAPTMILDFPQGIPTRGVTIRGDNARAYVMVNSPCVGPAPGFYVFDNTLATPSAVQGICLDPSTTMASEISVVSNNGNSYLYISRQSPPMIEVADVTAASLPTPIAPVTLFPVATNPDAIASDPLQSHVYVTLPGTNQFTVLDNTAVTPVQLAGAPYNLPDPTLAGTDASGGVTVPPNTSGTFPFSAYFTVPTTSVVDVTDDSGAPPPTKDAASPIPGLTAGSMPGRIASIPIPDAGLGLATRALPNAIAARTYNVYAVIRGGSAPYTCAATGLPGTLTVGPNAVAVPSGPLAGRQACQISGTAPGAGTFAVDLTVTDNSAPPLVASAGYSFKIRPEFAFNAPTALPVGVMSRTYGAPAATSPVETTNVSATVGNSPLVTCMVSGTGLNPSLTAAVAASNTDCTLSSGGANLAAAETDMLTFTATDTPIADAFTGIQAVPANPVAMASPVNLTVNMPLAIAPFVLGNAEVTAAYGQSLPTNIASGGGAGTLATCSFTVSPGGLTVGALGVNCNVTGPPTAIFGPSMVTVTAMDTGNTAVPSGVAMTASTNMFQVFPALALANTLGNGEVNAAYSSANAGATEPAISAGNPGATSYVCAFMGASPAGLNVAWNGVAGAGAGCTVSGTPTAPFASAAVSIKATESPAPSASSAAGVVTVASNSIQVFSALNIAATLGNGEVGAAYNSTNAGATEPAISGGNPAATSYTCLIAPPGNTLVNLSAAWNGSVGASAGCTVSGTPNAIFGPGTTTIQVTESPAPSFYSAAGANTGTSNSIQIFPALSLAATLGNGEVNAAYSSTNVGATEPAISGGFGGAISYVCTFTGTSPAGLAAAWNGTSGGGAGCTVSGTPSATFALSTTQIQVTESSAPSNYSAAGTFTATSNAIQVFAQVTLAGFALANGETGAPYSQLVAITNGNAPYTACTSMNLPAGLGSSVSTTNCKISGTPTVTFTSPPMISMTATDTAPSPYSAAGVSAAQTSNLTITAGVTLSAAGLPFGTGVTDRNFSQALTFSGGTGPYVCSATGLPTGLAVSTVAMTCVVSGTAPIPIVASTPVTITVTDADNSVSNQPSAIAINPELQIMTTQAQIPNALVKFPYPQAPTTVTFTVVPGTGDGTAVKWTQAGSTGTICTAPSGTMPAGINIAASTGVLSGTPTAASAADTDFSFNVCVEDGANASTAGGSFSTTTKYVLNVMDAFAYTVGLGTKTIEVFGTSQSSTAPNAAVTSIAAGGGGTPQAVAVTPNGRFAIVTEQGPDQIDVVDTITNTLITGSPFSLAATKCGAASGVKVDAKFVYIACDAVGGGKQEEVLVLDAVMLTSGAGISVQNQIATGVGTIPDSVAFNTLGTRAYVTLNGADQLMILDTTATPPAPIAATQTGNPAGIFNLPATTISPRGIAVLQNSVGAKDYAYIAKQTGVPGAPIAFVSASSDPSCVNTSNGAKTVSCLFTISANDTVVVMVGHPNPPPSVSTITDDGGNTYTRMAGCSSNNTTSAAVECFVTTPAGKTNAATTITVTLTANSQFTVSAAEYSGVTAIGNTNVNNTYTGATTTTNPSISLTTQDNGNVCVGGFNENSNEVISSGGAGITLRTSIKDNLSQFGAILDTAQATPGTCTVSASIGPTAHTWAVGVVELRNATVPGADVVDVTADPVSGPSGLTFVTSIAESPGTSPTDVAGLPGTPSGRAYVTLQGSNQFDVIDNTMATPVQISGAPIVGAPPFNLPDPTAGATSVRPISVVIPPSTASPFEAYITFNNTGHVGIIDDTSPPAIDATAPFTLTGGGTSAPGRAAAIPVPH